MRLYQRLAMPTRRLEISVQSDGMGGGVPVWTEGAPFPAAYALKSESETPLAGQTASARRYSVLAPRGLALKAGERIRREDGLVLRALSAPEDIRTPSGSALALCQFTAEAIEP